MAKRLTQEGQDLADEFAVHFDGHGCSCFANPPCSYCTHPGNPLCIEESLDLWKDEPTGEVDYLSITASFAKGTA